jgi:DNA-binding NtrC family response regulator
LLALDDDVSMHSMLVRFLGLCGDRARYDVAAVATPQEALAQVVARPVPLLLADYQLVGTTGLHVAVHMQHWSPMTTTILISAAVTAEMTALARAHRVTHVLQKPFAIATLQHVVAPVLQAWEATYGTRIRVGTE